MERRQLLGRVVFGAALAMMVAAAAGAQTAQAVAPKDIVGLWEGAAQTPNGEVALKVEFALKDDKLTGTIESSMGSMPVTSVTLTDDGIAMEIEVQGSPASLAAKVQGKRMEGTWTLGADSGPFALTKSGGTEPAPKK